MWSWLWSLASGRVRRCTGAAAGAAFCAERGPARLGLGDGWLMDVREWEGCAVRAAHKHTAAGCMCTCWCWSTSWCTVPCSCKLSQGQDVRCRLMCAMQRSTAVCSTADSGAKQAACMTLDKACMFTAGADSCCMHASWCRQKEPWQQGSPAWCGKALALCAVG
jgi:hypothetical protein